MIEICQHCGTAYDIPQDVPHAAERTMDADPPFDNTVVEIEFIAGLRSVKIYGDARCDVHPHLQARGA